MSTKDVIRDVALGALGIVAAIGLVWNMVEAVKYQMKYGFFARGQDDFRPFYLLLLAAGGYCVVLWLFGGPSN